MLYDELYILCGFTCAPCGVAVILLSFHIPDKLYSCVNFSDMISYRLYLDERFWTNVAVAEMIYPMNRLLMLLKVLLKSK